ncbi:hypothetical protein PV11_00007 [Exophiala sideris]|uniref:Uncharacterized protein n=1 Tax=Exophiala sideris TaxID=1016849 RepID=A0A0D1W6B4_9EURO|nr:hypothetical protein PV11_00007 [Exophiala sideris]
MAYGITLTRATKNLDPCEGLRCSCLYLRSARLIMGRRAIGDIAACFNDVHLKLNILSEVSFTASDLEGLRYLPFWSGKARRPRKSPELPSMEMSWPFFHQGLSRRMTDIHDLPHESLLQISEYLSLKPYGASDTCSYLLALSLTSKRFCVVSQELLYRAVVLSSPGSAIYFARTLSQHPCLGLLVRYFEAGVLKHQDDGKNCSDLDDNSLPESTVPEKDEVERYLLPPLRKWCSITPQVFEDIQSNKDAIWISSILSQLYNLTEVELQLGSSAQYLNGLIKWCSVEAKVGAGFMNVSSLSLLANEDVGIDVAAILQLPCLTTFRSWGLRAHSLPRTTEDISVTLCRLELYHPHMDEGEVVKLLRSCHNIRRFELQPILGMTQGFPWYHAERVAQRIIAGLDQCKETLQVLEIDTWTTSQSADETIDLSGYRKLIKLMLPATEVVTIKGGSQTHAQLAILPTSLKSLLIVMAPRGRANGIRSALLRYVENGQFSRDLTKLDITWERCPTPEIPEMRDIECACVRRGILFSSRLSHR